LLKVVSIEFTDLKERTYRIESYQLQDFFLNGGAEANLIKTKAWNQHGNTFVNSYMESAEGNLIFALYTANKSAQQIEDLRREISNICNPLNGVVEMKITLNNENIYRRDITFTTAPIFPIGFENRNNQWQIIQLQYEANNPFWYSDQEIVETFQTSIPLFEFPVEFVESGIEFGSYIPSKMVVNNGQVEAPITIIIEGACVNPIIENLTTGEMIRFKNLVMTAEDRLLIDTSFGNKKVILNDTKNMFYALDFSTTFFHLQIGENEIDFRDDTLLTPEATIYFIYRNMFHTI